MIIIATYDFSAFYDLGKSSLINGFFEGIYGDVNSYWF